MVGLIGVVFKREFDEAGRDRRDRKNIRQINEKSKVYWENSVKLFLEMVKWMEKKEDIDEKDEHGVSHKEEILREVHSLCARFMCNYCSAFRDDNKCVTNYIHVIGAGHLVFYLKKYKNLARFQQQGWEALNGLLKHFFLNNTNHGGSEGRNKEKVRDCGKPGKALARLCMRRNMWFFGIGRNFFNGIAVDGSEIDPEDYKPRNYNTAAGAARIAARETAAADEASDAGGNAGAAVDASGTRRRRVAVAAALTIPYGGDVEMEDLAGVPGGVDREKKEV